MNINEFLNPCPFCGGVNIQTDDEYGLVWCGDCFITPRDSNGGVERDTWNRHTPEPGINVFVVSEETSPQNRTDRIIGITLSIVGAEELAARSMHRALIQVFPLLSALPEGK